MAETISIGGAGGTGRGSGQGGGSGGTVTGLALVTSSGGAGSARVVAVGGAGGAGLDGADGGDGAAAELVDAVSGSTIGTLSLVQDARGGAGANGSNGGLGGAARSIGHGSNAGDGFAAFRSLADGGAGGQATSESGVSGDGGRAEAIAFGRTGLSTLARARGGSGGAAYPSATSVAGRGGDAIVEVNAPSARAFEFGAFGGEGGALSSSGLGGAGGNAQSRTVGIADYQFLVDRATGGKGGSARINQLVSGARGGDAFSSVQGVGGPSVWVEAHAHGGAGGAGRGAGFRGGAGGTAAATGSGASTSGPVRVSANQTGGPGGDGLAGADGEDGARVDMVDAVSGSTPAALELRQRSTGGDGGSAEGAGRPGAGAAATSALRASNEGGGSLSAFSEAFGGAGAPAAAMVPAGAGGAAQAGIVGSSDSLAPVVLTAEADGGDGGTASGEADGGAGGAASLGLVHGSSGAGGDVTVIGRARSGMGGMAMGGGQSGDSASVNLVDSVSGATSGRLRLVQEARGGPSSGLGARPGNARSVLERSVSAGALELEVVAEGGHAVGATTGEAAPDGGWAEARVGAVNDAGDASTIVFAHGENGGDARAPGMRAGNGGAATGFARAETWGDEHDVEVGRDSYASAVVGGNSGWIGNGMPDATVSAGAGGTATSESIGIAHGNSRVTVMDLAIGGESGSSRRTEAPSATGGSAMSRAEGRNVGSQPVEVTSIAIGGVGGSGDYATGGAGGSASATARGSSTGGGDVTVTAIQTGGNAGYSSGAPEHTAGAGAPSALINAVSGETGGTLTLVQNAVGGDAGLTERAAAPALPGDASSELQATNPAGGALVLVSEALGGAAATHSMPGGRGMALVIGKGVGGQHVSVSAIAQGGAGALAFYPDRIGGLGGEPAFGPVEASSDLGDVEVRAQGVGGTGGSNDYAGGPSGAGRSVELVDVPRGHSAGRLSLYQTAVGGAGGSGGGAGGDATSSLTRSGEVSSLTVGSEAIGGATGAYAFDLPGAAGDAHASVSATNSTGEVIALGRAVGGAGGYNSAAGDSQVDAVAFTIGDGHAVRVGALDANEAGSLGGDADFWNGPGGAGDATSRSLGVAFGDSEVSVYDQALGGDGGAATGAAETDAPGGDAASHARAIGAGGSVVRARSWAAGGDGAKFSWEPSSDYALTSPGHGGAAVSSAEAIGAGEVEAVAHAVGGTFSYRAELPDRFHLPEIPETDGFIVSLDVPTHLDGTAHASARAVGASGVARAEVTSGGTPAGLVTAVAEAPAAAGGNADSRTSVGELAWNNAVDDAGSSVQATLRPRSDSAATLLSGHSRVKAGFGGDEEFAFLAASHLHVGSPEWALSGPLVYRVEAEFAFASGIAEGRRDLLLGIFDADFVLSELDEFHLQVDEGGSTRLEVRSSDPASLEQLLDDRVIDVGDVLEFPRGGASPQLFELHVLLELRTSSARSAASLGFVVGHAMPIPEPASALLLAAGLSLLAGARRYRGADPSRSSSSSRASRSSAGSLAPKRA